MHRDESARFSDLFDRWTNTCQQRFDQYKQDTTEIQADLEVLGRLADYLAENVSAMEDYLMDRVNF